MSIFSPLTYISLYSPSPSLSLLIYLSQIDALTHTHTHTHIYIYIYNWLNNIDIVCLHFFVLILSNHRINSMLSGRNLFINLSHSYLVPYYILSDPWPSLGMCILQNRCEFCTNISMLFWMLIYIGVLL